MILKVIEKDCLYSYMCRPYKHKEMCNINLFATNASQVYTKPYLLN